MQDKNNFTFGKFIKKLWWVLLILIAIPLLTLIIFTVFTVQGICNISDLMSMLGGILAYVGTVLLGLISVWQVERQRKENLETILEQNFEQNKGSLQIYIEVIYNNVVLVIKNMGKSEIYDGSILFSKDWIEQLDNFGDVAIQLKKSLLKSISNNIYLAANQEIRFLLYFIQDNDNYYEFLTGQDCPVSISYNTLSKRVEQKINLNFHSALAAYYGLNIKEESINVLEKNYEKQIEEIKHISAGIKTLNANIIEVYKRLSDFSVQDKKHSDE